LCFQKQKPRHMVYVTGLGDHLSLLDRGRSTRFFQVNVLAV
jgi:hypothetical protein